MKPNDFSIDLQDLIGKLIPGFLILVSLYILFGWYFKDVPFESLYVKHTVFVYLFIAILSYFLGDLNNYFSFRLRDILHVKAGKQTSVKDFISDKDKTGKLLKLFEEEFGAERISQHYRSLHFFCKKCTVDALPLALKKVKKTEATINYRLSMMTPLLMISVISFKKQLYAITIISILLIPVLYLTSIRITKNETYLIYINYYQFISNREFSKK